MSTWTNYKDHFEKIIKGHQAMLDSLDNLLLGQGHVVCFIDNGLVLPVNYKLDEFKRATECFATTLGKAHRWTKADAEKLAKGTKNGNNETPVALHIREALELDIAGLTKIIKEVEENESRTSV